MSTFRTLNDFRVLFDIQYEYATAAQQAIIYELRQLRNELQSSNNNLSSDLALAILQVLNKVG